MKIVGRQSKADAVEHVQGRRGRGGGRGGRELSEESRCQRIEGAWFVVIRTMLSTHPSVSHVLCIHSPV